MKEEQTVKSNGKDWEDELYDAVKVVTGILRKNCVAFEVDLSYTAIHKEK